MTIDEFIEKVASEKSRTYKRQVARMSPALERKLKEGGHLMVSELESDPERTLEWRIFREAHVIGPGLSLAQIRAWQAKWPNHPLPGDLVELLQQINGIHLWADMPEGRSYEGIAPLEEWGLARNAMYGSDADPDLLEERYLALSYHSDSAVYIVLNVECGKYFWMDSCGPDEGSLIGASVGELLDWVWEHRIPSEE